MAAPPADLTTEGAEVLVVLGVLDAVGPLRLQESPAPIRTTSTPLSAACRAEGPRLMGSTSP